MRTFRKSGKTIAKRSRDTKSSIMLRPDRAHSNHTFEWRFGPGVGLVSLDDQAKQAETSFASRYRVKLSPAHAPAYVLDGCMPPATAFSAGTRSDGLRFVLSLQGQLQGVRSGGVPVFQRTVPFEEIVERGARFP